jgi:tRNA(fMet)-specific endonuclease VapC
MTRYMLDTNTISHLMRMDRPVLEQRVKNSDPNNLSMSSLTAAEIMYGLEKRGNPQKLVRLANALLTRIETVSWPLTAARVFSAMRAAQETRGISLSLFDMLIAAHAKSIGSILVSSDSVFRRIKDEGFVVEDWAQGH